MNNSNKQHKAVTWWGPVWRGLVVDEKARHYRAMRNALWLFLYLVLHANRKTGELRRKYDTVARDMGIGERTARRWLERLSKSGYVTVTRTGRSQIVYIRKWKTLLPDSRRARNGP